MDDVALVRSVRALLAQTVESLEAIGAHDETIAELTRSRGFAVFRSRPRMAPLGRAWRLGVLLLDREGRLYSTGSITRAVEPGRVTNQSAAFEERRSYRTAAFRGPFSPGEVVNFDIIPIAIDADSLRAGSGPLFLDGDSDSDSDSDGVMVHWDSHPGAGFARLDRYLAERTELLTQD